MQGGNFNYRDLPGHIRLTLEHTFNPHPLILGKLLLLREMAEQACHLGISGTANNPKTRCQKTIGGEIVLVVNEASELDIFVKVIGGVAVQDNHGS